MDRVGQVVDFQKICHAKFTWYWQLTDRSLQRKYLEPVYDL